MASKKIKATGLHIARKMADHIQSSGVVTVDRDMRDLRCSFLESDRGDAEAIIAEALDLQEQFDREG